jgi:hypothetical protein
MTTKFFHQCLNGSWFHEVNKKSEFVDIIWRETTAGAIRWWGALAPRVSTTFTVTCPTRSMHAGT